jgi:hypothetical protein
VPLSGYRSEADSKERELWDGYTKLALEETKRLADGKQQPSSADSSGSAGLQRVPSFPKLQRHPSQMNEGELSTYATRLQRALRAALDRKRNVQSQRLKEQTQQQQTQYAQQQQQTEAQTQQQQLTAQQQQQAKAAALHPIQEALSPSTASKPASSISISVPNPSPSSAPPAAAVSPTLSQRFNSFVSRARATRNPGDNHLYVIRSDIRRVACDAWLLPSGGMITCFSHAFSFFLLLLFFCETALIF